MTPGKIMLIFGSFCTIFFAAIPNVIWLVCWLVAMIFGRHLRYAPFGWTALALAVIVALLMVYGFYIGRWRIKVKDVPYENKEIPAAFEGFRLVHISDLHLSTFDDRPSQLQRFVDEINAQKPDLICFTGDLVTMGSEEARPYTDILKQLHSPNGVISVLGNHDFLIYSPALSTDEKREAAVEQLADYEKDTLGWNLLRNSSAKIDSADSSFITIVGVDNRNCSGQGFQTIDRGDLPKAMAIAMEIENKPAQNCCHENAEASDSHGRFRILLSHDPSHWDAEVRPKTDIQLTLSGHTHASQICIFGWNPASLMFKESYGRYDNDGQTIYVNPGLGCTAPFRIGARPEITVITLHHAE